MFRWGTSHPVGAPVLRRPRLRFHPADEASARETASPRNLRVGILALTWAQLDSAALDMRNGLLSWRLGSQLAWQDVKQRYRRSTLGPIWITLTSGVQIFTITFVSSFLFGSPFQKVLPFVCAGLLFWNFITQSLNEGAAVFISASSYMTQIKRPMTIFLIQAIWRNVIMLGHNAIVYVVVAVALGVVPGASIFLWPLGFVLVVACVSWMALICGVISARYRDVPVIIANILNILFWFTPLMYFPSQLGSKQYIADYNPFTHIMALVREPLLGGAPTLDDWLIVLVVTIVGWACTFLFFARFRARIVYWL